MRISDWSSDVCSSDLLADLRFRPLVDFEHDIDAVLVERDHLGLDRRGEAALPLVELDNARDVGADFRSRVDLARRHLDFGTDLGFIKALVRSEGRRGGEEVVSKWRCWWFTEQRKKK